jgi:hypothetical protein
LSGGFNAAISSICDTPIPGDPRFIRHCHDGALWPDWILNASGLLRYWWVYIPATAAVMLFGIAWNLLGDGINDLLDPYSL